MVYWHAVWASGVIGADPVEKESTPEQHSYVVKY